MYEIMNEKMLGKNPPHLFFVSNKATARKGRRDSGKTNRGKFNLQTFGLNCSLQFYNTLSQKNNVYNDVDNGEVEEGKHMF